ncbi:MAG: zinc ribbon domain-containing protein [Actinomycetota bacterium]
MKCGKCGQEVPEGAVYCPFCTAEGASDEKEVIRGGVRGGLIGLVLGLIPAVILLSIYGPERGIKAIAFAVPVATFTTGLILGLVKAKRNWK